VVPLVMMNGQSDAWAGIDAAHIVKAVRSLTRAAQ
jgi:hypothetical protein